MEHIWFNGWSSILRTLLLGVTAYIGLVMILRVFGKRTLSKMNAFDLVVTVALGSTLATILLSKDVSLVQGLLAFFTLIALQYLVTWGIVRSRRFSRLIKSSPTLLFYKGEFLHDVMRRERFLSDEVRAAIRENGQGNLEEIFAVVLETDGTLSVIPELKHGEDTHGALENVTNEQDVGLGK